MEHHDVLQLDRHVPSTRRAASAAALLAGPDRPDRARGSWRAHLRQVPARPEPPWRPAAVVDRDRRRGSPRRARAAGHVDGAVCHQATRAATTTGPPRTRSTIAATRPTAPVARRQASRGRGLRDRVRRAGRGRPTHGRCCARHPRCAPHLAPGRRQLRRDAGPGRRARLPLPAPAEQQRRQGRQRQPRAHACQGRLLLHLRRRLRAAARSSSSRCCPSSPTRPWPSSRHRRPTATCTP